MNRTPPANSPENRDRGSHTRLKWLLSLLSVVATSVLVLLLDRAL